MTNQEMLGTLAKLGAIITNSHIVYTSGKHGNVYVNKDAIYPHTEVTSSLCKVVADHFSKSEIDAVVAPAVGGVILSQWVAHHLSLEKRKVLALYAEKSADGSSFIIKRGYDTFVPGRKILVVEDVLTTGASVRNVVRAVHELNGKVVGVACLCNRGTLKAKDLGTIGELYSLLEINLETWDATACPLCLKNVPINTRVGKGLEFIQSQRKTV